MEILNTIEADPVMTSLSTAFVVLVLLGIAAFVVGLIKSGEEWKIAGSLLVTIGLFAGVLSEPDVTRHEVLISDMNEVYDQGYRVVEQRGDIHIIEKDNSVETEGEK